MVLLAQTEFLRELDSLYSSASDRGSVYVCMKRSALRRHDVFLNVGEDMTFAS
jgi:Signal recognition particle 14kD protein